MKTLLFKGLEGLTDLGGHVIKTTKCPRSGLCAVKDSCGILANANVNTILA